MIDLLHYNKIFHVPYFLPKLLYSHPFSTLLCVDYTSLSYQQNLNIKEAVERVVGVGELIEVTHNGPHS